MKTSYSEEIAVSIFRFLCTDEWHFGFHGEDGVFQFGLTISNRLESVKYLVRIYESNYSVICICPIHADTKNKKQMAEMADFLHLTNYDLRNGNFELNIRDGEIRFKIFVDCEGLSSPTADMVSNSIYVGATIYSRYGNGIYHIIEDGMTAKEAIALCNEDEDDIAEIIDDGDEAPAEDDSAVPNSGALDDEDNIAALMRMIRGT